VKSSKILTTHRILQDKNFKHEECWVHVGLHVGFNAFYHAEKGLSFAFCAHVDIKNENIKKH